MNTTIYEQKWTVTPDGEIHIKQENDYGLYDVYLLEADLEQMLNTLGVRIMPLQNLTDEELLREAELSENPLTRELARRLVIELKAHL